MQTLRIPRAQGLEEQFSSHPTPLRKRKEGIKHQMEFRDYIQTESSWPWWQLCGNGREALHPPAMVVFNGKLHHIPKPDTWCEGHLTDVLSWVVPRKRQWLQLCIRQLRETADSWEQHTVISRHLLNGGFSLRTFRYRWFQQVPPTIKLGIWFHLYSFDTSRVTDFSQSSLFPW